MFLKFAGGIVAVEFSVYFLSHLKMFCRLLQAAALLMSCLFALGAQALEQPHEELQKASITTQLGTQVDLDREFRDESGNPITLRQAARDGRPFIVVPAYYHCPRLCGLILKGVKELLPQLGLVLGSDYRVLTISFDPEDTPKNAASRAAENRAGLEAAGDPVSGWKFLIGEQENIEAVMGQLGFHYLPDNGEFAHSAAIMILTPEGQISQYFTGISFSPRDVKLALVEAGRGSIGSAIDHFLLFCFQFDSTKGRYTWAAFNLVRAGSALVFLFLAGLIFVMLRRERSSSLKHQES